ncbi:hypothetical protein MUDAN_DOGOELCO_03319 [Lactiplantibacillus mudanjiangensis]|uniref:hypothetical protein n=1 Tax=Lactiplantibacillus mudanjiangensis TaxID=1296538 RepID=UPI001015A773|nr:hypothetical protein [Lactiplantibacillus mudanjiangensis]VDG31475.1 hypothetical protein MUDAN_DOGOELCO_03319 [Lactiplantibacillus mudanjiangensis]
MNDHKMIPFIIWLILKLRRSSWEAVKESIDSEFNKISKMDVIPTERQEDIQSDVLKKLKGANK